MTPIALAAAALAGTLQVPAPDVPAHPVLELRQYKIVAGKRDAFIDFFESHFVESQEALGMRLVGQFRDHADPTRFVWLRAFPSMEVRGKALSDFYFGPVWRQHRDVANPMLDDNDDVLLLKPAWADANFAVPNGVRPPPAAQPTPGETIVATIEYLWKDPGQGYAAYFRDQLSPAYRAAGLPVLGAFVAEDQPNNFPRLYVRQNERVFVWFTRVRAPRDYAVAIRRLEAGKSWRLSLGPSQKDYLERQPQVLMLSPTPRSMLR